MANFVENIFNRIESLITQLKEEAAAIKWRISLIELKVVLGGTGTSTLGSVLNIFNRIESLAWLRWCALVQS